MAFKDLRGFISFLEAKGHLARVAREVDPVLEITEVTDRVSKRVGPGLIFEKAKGSSMPVAINLMGSYERMAWALGIGEEESWRSGELGDATVLDAVAARFMDLVPADMPARVRDKIGMLLKLNEVAGYRPKEVKGPAPCQEVVLQGADVDLGLMPVLKCWPGDAGRFITLGLVHTKHAGTGRQNMGMYRLQVYDKNTTGMHWHVHHDGAHNFRSALGADVKGFEVAVALGGDPATIYSATAPLPPGFDEHLFAGFLRGEALEVVRCKTVDLVVPAQSEIVLEGYVDLEERRLEGPFGDHTGYYSLADDYPVFHVECMTMRSDPIYPTTIVGKPPMEDCYMGKATERIFLPAVKATCPEVKDMNLPLEGVFHNCAIVSIKKDYAGQAFKVMNTLWGLGQMMLTKYLIVVDDTVDAQDLSEVAWRCFNNVDPGRDLLLSKGPLDALDHSSPLWRFGMKMGIDATKKWPEEGHPREWPEAMDMDPDTRARVDAVWEELGL
jgi:4-hydroxy-3-polyprenylbenzoate decarboxylase